MQTKEFEFVLFGASSFVGKILTRHLSDPLFTDGALRWAIAGRNEKKLDALLEEFPEERRPEIIVADAGDEDALTRLAKRTQVVVSTVGPFAKYGSTLVKVCAETGTDYCDITGEVHWVLKMISEHQARAQQSGARIVHCCGFDSIPSDLGVYFTQRMAKQRFGKACDEINMRVTKIRGAFSGGTYASLLNAVDELSNNPGLRKTVVSPYCLCPENHPYSQRQTRHQGASYDEISEKWIAPFVMEGVNTRIVHRSNALFGNDYGENFRYDEAVVTGSGRKGRKRASRTALGLKALMIAASLPPIRALLARFFLPKPGEGPSPDEQFNGEYEYTFFGKAKGKGNICCRVHGDRDPGYGSTSKVLGQVALFLAREIPKDEVPGGFWTPATLFRTPLIERLQSHAGLTFSVIEGDKR